MATSTRGGKQAFAFWSIATVACVLVALLCSRAASARDPETTRLVFMAPGNDPALAESGVIKSSLEAARAQLTGLPVKLLVVQVPQLDSLSARMIVAGQLAHKHAARGAFWLEPSNQGDILVFLFDAEGKRVLVRRLEAEALSNSILAEQVAVVIRSAAIALAEGRVIGMRPAHISEPSEVTEPTRPITATSTKPGTSQDGDGQVHIALRYGVQHIGPSSLQHIVGPELSLDFAPGWYAGIHGFWAFPHSLQFEEATAQLSQHSAGAHLGVRHREGKVTLGLQLGPDLRLSRRVTTAVDPAYRSTQPRTELHGGAALELRVSLDLGSNWSAVASTGTQVWQSEQHFRVGTREAFTAQRWVPYLTLGLGWIP